MDDVLSCLQHRPSWHRHAACAQVSSTVFFTTTRRATAEARRLCTSCEVRDRCLADALKHRDEHGVWGGLTPDERAVLLVELDDLG